MFTIEKNIPVFEQKNRTKWPFDSMSVGDSVFIDKEKFETSKARVAAHVYGHASGKKFKTRMQDNGIRVWRVA